MGFVLVAYEALKIKVTESIATLERHHIAKKEQVPKHRLAQVNFLKEMVTHLDKLSSLDKVAGQENERAYVFNMAVYLVRDKISELEYPPDNIRINPLRQKPTDSNFYNSLTTSLDINKENSPASEELEIGYTKLEKFLRVHTYIDGNVKKGYLVPQNFKIANYNVEDDIKCLIKKRADLAIDSITVAFDAHTAAQNAAAAKPPKPVSAKGLFSVFSSKGDGADKKPIVTAAAPVATAKPVAPAADSIDENAVNSPGL